AEHGDEQRGVGSTGLQPVFCRRRRFQPVPARVRQDAERPGGVTTQSMVTSSGQPAAGMRRRPVPCHTTSWSTDMSPGSRSSGYNEPTGVVNDEEPRNLATDEHG
ncbi:MAG: hypothetical protein KDD83_27220, partial [Caldilineaceae bacterium]|nr:hypothetical protein [Caldilineaceae bacterium]